MHGCNVVKMVVDDVLLHKNQGMPSGQVYAMATNKEGSTVTHMYLEWVCMFAHYSYRIVESFNVHKLICTVVLIYISIH